MSHPKDEVTLWLSLDYEGLRGRPRKVCSMPYEQWRSGHEIPRLSILELGAVHPGVLPPVPLYDRLRGFVVRQGGILSVLYDSAFFFALMFACIGLSLMVQQCAQGQR